MDCELWLYFTCDLLVHRELEFNKNIAEITKCMPWFTELLYNLTTSNDAIAV